MAELSKPLEPMMAYALGRAFPDWMAALSEATAKTVAARVHGPTVVDFVLTTNWVLLPGGVQDFYEVLYQQPQNLEVVYDRSLHGFKIRSWSHDQGKIAKLVQSIMDQLVPKITRNGFEKSNKVVALRDWRKAPKSLLQAKEGLNDKYSFPRDVALCDVRSTWDLPQGWTKKGVSLGDMISENALLKVQQQTKTKLVVSCNDRQVYIGASAPENVEAVKQKLTNIARYFYYLYQQDTPEVVGVYLCNEGDTCQRAEYRFMADSGDPLLKSYILDRFTWPSNTTHYKFLFRKAVIVRLNPINEPGKQVMANSGRILPAVPQDKIKTETFNAFKPSNWRYRPKKPDEVQAPSMPDSTGTNNHALVIQDSGGPPHRRSPATESDTKLRDPVKTTTKPLQPLVGAGAKGEVTEAMPSASTSPVDLHAASLVQHQRSQHDGDDPFLNLWANFQSTGAPHSHLGQNDDQKSRTFQVTMRQKAGARPVAQKVFPDIHPDTMVSIKKSLKTLMAPLTMLPGIVDLKVDLGRLCFVNIKKSQIQKPEEDDQDKYHPLQVVKDELQKRHDLKRHIYFTQILTCIGADANYICHLENDDGTPMWHRPINGRTSAYEFICRAAVDGIDFHFIVEIDALKFTSQIKHFEPQQKFFAVHCTKRVWDFRLTLSSSHDLNKTCGRFAADLVRSLRVTPGKDVTPELEVSCDMSYSVEILAVRTRNTASCTSKKVTVNTPTVKTESLEDFQTLDITEVWEMDRISKQFDGQFMRLKFARYKTQLVQSSDPALWYEVSLRSDQISTALEQNRKLEVGEEANWEANALVDCGAVDKLINKAAQVVKKLDGVGYWNDNQQEGLLQKVAPAPKSKVGQDLDKFW